MGMIWSPNIFSMLPKARIPSGQFGQSVPVNSSITKRLVGAKARFLIEYPVVFSSSSKVISNVNLFAMPTLSGRAFGKAKSYLSPFFKERPDSLISSMALPLASFMIMCTLWYVSSKALILIRPLILISFWFTTEVSLVKPTKNFWSLVTSTLSIKMALWSSFSFTKAIYTFLPLNSSSFTMWEVHSPANLFSSSPGFSNSS